MPRALTAAFVALALLSACEDKQDVAPMTPLPRPAVTLDDAGMRLTGDPMDPEALYRAMQELYLAQQYDKAAEVGRKLVGLKPSPQAWHLLGEALFAAKKLPEAVDAYGEAVKLDPRKVVSLSRMNDAQMQLGRYRDAVQSARKIQELSPDRPEGFRREADAQAMRDQFAPAAAALGRALALDPPKKPDDVAKAYKLLGELELRGGKPDAAVTALKKSADAHPDMDVFELLGDAYASAGDLPAAAEAFDKAVSLLPSDSKDAGLYEVLGELRLRLGQLDRARAAYERALTMRERARAHVGLGRIALAEKKPAAAEAELEKATKSMTTQSTVTVDAKDENPEARRNAPVATVPLLDDVLEVSRFALELKKPRVAVQTLERISAEAVGARSPDLWREMARAKQQLKDKAGVKEACDKRRALLPEADASACP